MQGRRGRPQAPAYKATNGTKVAGLSRGKDGRWRAVVNGREIRWTEPDEQKAVQKARALLGTDDESSTIIEATIGEVIPNVSQTLDEITPEHADRLSAIYDAGGDNDVETEADTTLDEFPIRYRIPDAVLYAWIHKQLSTHPVAFAAKVGIPELAGFRYLKIPGASLKLTTLLETYTSHADVKETTKMEWANTFETFMTITGAKTLGDCTAEALTKYRDAMKKSSMMPGTIAAYFGRVKGIIAFAKSEGLDAPQIDEALSRMAILKAPKDRRTHQPTPISRESLHAIHKAAGALYPEWQPRILIMLNLCLHFDEALDVEWTDFNLDGETFCTRRNKRGRVIRAATLWTETITALKAITRTGSPYVFVSTHGTRFNAKGQWKTWQKIRQAAGCPAVQMDDIRDGAYTAAANAAGVEEKIARLMAGHRSHGLQDNYVERNPAIVKPACDAVHRHYFG